jgi:hypothetical protein
MNLELREAIEHLYKVFNKYPANPNMDGSPMYHDLAQWNRALLAKPLRELSMEEDLNIYYAKAMTTWGDLNDFKHFLPRIFELLTIMPTGIMEEVALGKLRYGHYETWPATEQAAIHWYLLAFWQVLLNEESEWIDALFHAYFPAIANVFPDFNQLLELWATADSQVAAQRLASFVYLNEERILKKAVLLGFQNLAPLDKQFFEWLHSAPALSKLRQAKPSEDEPYLNLQLVPIIQQLEQQQS